MRRADSAPHSVSHWHIEDCVNWIASRTSDAGDQNSKKLFHGNLLEIARGVGQPSDSPWMPRYDVDQASMKAG
jgi:hypothetical protein